MRTLATAVALVALAAAGCGGNANHAAAPPPPPPKLPRSLAQSWAQQADAIAASLAAGDGCTAEIRAVALRTQVVQSVNDRRIPTRYLEPLVATVNDLPNRITCAVAPAPAANTNQGDTNQGHGDKHGHKNKHGDQGGGGD